MPTRVIFAGARTRQLTLTRPALEATIYDRPDTDALAASHTAARALTG